MEYAKEISVTITVTSLLTSVDIALATPLDSARRLFCDFCLMEVDDRSHVNCPNCRLVNPPAAERCDCGYDFATKSLKSSYIVGSTDVSSLATEVIRGLGRRDLMVGGAWLGVGLLATIGSYAFAATQADHSYVVAYGAIVVGVVRLGRGLYRTQANRPSLP